MKLEEIGFYTLSDKRAKTASENSPLQRCELILTDKCNLRCPYCRGMRTDFAGGMGFEEAKNVIDLWAADHLVNIRFSGGEPTLCSYLGELVAYARNNGVTRVAISTNGTGDLDTYLRLIDFGANDFSVSLDAGCCSIGKMMAGGVSNAWEKASETIRQLSRRTYVTVGIVFNEINSSRAVKTVLYANSLSPSDIRIIPSAQYDKAVQSLADLSDDVIGKYPILKYRINKMREGKHVRGITDTDTRCCPLVLDDMAVAKGWHFPCIIYMREHGDPIGRVSSHMRQERLAWCRSHNTHSDPICRKNCLDVCVAYNNRFEELHRGNMFYDLLWGLSTTWFE